MDENELTFSQYQQQASKTDLTRGNDLKTIMVPLLGLAGETGSLLTEYKKYLREGDRYKPFTDQVSEELGDILWYVANIAEKAGLNLHEIAQENLAKLSDLTGKSNNTLFAADRYDSKFPEHERLPVELRVEFREELINGIKKLKLTCNGKPFGDPLTDNAYVNDGYRFHDVFHLSYAIFLGWSPIVRRLLNLKRKSDSQVNEVEDGGRAAVTEEAISILVFGYAKDYSFFEGAESVDYELLRAIRLMTRPLEVRHKNLRDWEEAILRGYEVWRRIKANNGGVFVGDAKKRSVGYEPLPE